MYNRNEKRRNWTYSTRAKKYGIGGIHPERDKPKSVFEGKINIFIVIQIQPKFAQGIIRASATTGRVFVENSRIFMMKLIVRCVKGVR